MKKLKQNLSYTQKLPTPVELICQKSVQKKPWKALRIIFRFGFIVWIIFLFLKYLLIKINNQIREMSNFDAVRPISLIWISELGLIIAIDGFRIIHILSLHIPVMFTTNTLIIQWMFLHKSARIMFFTKKTTSNIVLISFSKSNLLFVMEKLCEGPIKRALELIILTIFLGIWWIKLHLQGLS